VERKGALLSQGDVDLGAGLRRPGTRGAWAPFDRFALVRDLPTGHLYRFRGATNKSGGARSNLSRFAAMEHRGMWSVSNVEMLIFYFDIRRSGDLFSAYWAEKHCQDRWPAVANVQWPARTAGDWPQPLATASRHIPGTRLDSSHAAHGPPTREALQTQNSSRRTPSCARRSSHPAEGCRAINTPTGPRLRHFSAARH